MQILEIHYIGRTKERQPGNFSALGWVNNAWSVIIPETVLRKWFCEEDPRAEKTLYGVLGIPKTTSHEEIKSAYRRMARSYHPDVCKEPDAHEVFLRIQEAYNILNDQVKRAKYDAGLALQQKMYMPSSAKNVNAFGFRSPLRCGALLVEGNQSGKWFVVEQIIAWEDIVNSRGEVLVSSWVYGEDKPIERWVSA